MQGVHLQRLVGALVHDTPNDNNSVILQTIKILLRSAGLRASATVEIFRACVYTLGQASCAAQCEAAGALANAAHHAPHAPILVRAGAVEALLQAVCTSNDLTLQSAAAAALQSISHHVRLVVLDMHCSHVCILYNSMTAVWRCMPCPGRCHSS